MPGDDVLHRSRAWANEPGISPSGLFITEQRLLTVA
jgi:hypothetical protein